MIPLAILAGGLATRLHPITQFTPKSLLPINDVPFIDLQMKLLKKAGFSDLVICLGNKSEEIMEHVSSNSNYGINIKFSFDGDSQIGTGGAILNALPLLGDTFGVIYGDSYLDFDYNAAIKKFKNSNKSALMTIFANMNPIYKNNVYFENDTIITYSKSEPILKMKHIDYGFSVFSKHSFEAFSGYSGYFDLATVVEKLAQMGDLEAFEVGETFYEIGSFQGISDLERYLKGRA